MTGKENAEPPRPCPGDSDWESARFCDDLPDNIRDGTWESARESPPGSTGDSVRGRIRYA